MAERRQGRQRLGQHLPPGQLPRAFGGYKNSGVGRENGIDAVNEYRHLKSFWIHIGATVPNPFAPR